VLLSLDARKPLWACSSACGHHVQKFSLVAVCGVALEMITDPRCLRG
jgi:hypothetical protein